VKKFIHIPQAFLQSCVQFDTIQEAVAKVSNSRGMLIEVAKSYACSEDKKYTQIGYTEAHTYKELVEVVGYNKQTKEFKVIKSDVRIISAIPVKGDKVSLVVRDALGETDGFIMPKDELMLFTAYNHGKTMAEFKKLLLGESTIQAANKSAQKNGHVQKAPVKFGENKQMLEVVDTHHTAAASKSPNPGESRYRYIQFTQQGDYVGDVELDQELRKQLQNKFTYISKRTGVPTNDPTLTVTHGLFKYRRSLIK
jgi:hypothetical protein